MTTSEDQSTMRKLPDHSRVRRRLFEDEVKDQASVDNYANILQETSKQDSEHMMKKWNFDFINDVPLEGPYEWFRKDGENWIGIKPLEEKTSIECDDKFVPINNEVTPKVMQEEKLPVVRKRRRDTSVNGRGARRKISFD